MTSSSFHLVAPGHAGVGHSATASRLQLAAWMTQIGTGNESALAELFDATSATVYGTLLGILGDPADAETVARDVYLELWRTAGRFDAATRDASLWIGHIVARQLWQRRRSPR